MNYRAGNFYIMCFFLSRTLRLSMILEKELALALDQWYASLFLISAKKITE